MIEESYVSFDTAKMLKEAGFDEVCSTFYVSGKGDTCLMYERNSRLDKGQYSCPTQALAARWLREVHHLHVYPDRDLYAGRWFHVIRHTETDSTAVSDSVFETAEQAFEAGLQEALMLIIKN